MSTRTQESLVWRPGGASDNGKLLTWTEVYAAFQKTVGVCEILLDCALSTTFTMEVAAYDFEHRAIFRVKRNSISEPTVTINAGTTFANFYMIDGAVRFEWTGAGTLCTLTAGNHVFLRGYAHLRTTGGGRWFDTSARALILHCDEATFTNVGGGVIVHGSGGGLGLTLDLLGHNYIEQDSIDSVAGTPTTYVGVQIGLDVAGVGANGVGTQAGLAGGVTYDIRDTQAFRYHGVYVGGAGLVTSYMGMGSAPAQRL